jgi:rRNA maturation endonuclease Nob1
MTITTTTTTTTTTEKKSHEAIATAAATSEVAATLRIVCYRRVKDASFVHGQILHQAWCYPCAKRIFKEKARCPICRRQIEKITKHIVVS